jgi:hypothetical protein
MPFRMESKWESFILEEIIALSQKKPTPTQTPFHQEEDLHQPMQILVQVSVQVSNTLVMSYIYIKSREIFSTDYAKGNVAAGYKGGQGQTYSNSKAQQIAIPLGFGTTLLSNLPTSANETVASKNASENALNDKSKVVQVPLQAEKRNETVTPTATSSTTTNNRLIFN